MVGFKPTMPRRKRTCQQCGLMPSFAFEGQSATWCATHKPSGAQNVVNPRCRHVGCKKRPSFGLQGEGARWCAAHAPPEAKDVVHKRCRHVGCTRIPCYGVPGQHDRPQWCVQHAPPDAEDIANKRCEHPGCRSFRSYGMPVDHTCNTKQRLRWCARHRPADAVDMRNARCRFPGCDVTVPKKGNYCASHDTETKRRTRVRENQVANYLRDRALNWTSWNKQVSERACGIYRPDFVFEVDTHVVILEVDEYQHARPGYTCDNARMLDVFGAYGGVPVVFLRFNPDTFACRGKVRVRRMADRLPILEHELRAALASPPCTPLTITRMFYDRASDDRLVVTTWVSPDDPRFVERCNS